MDGKDKPTKSITTVIYNCKKFYRTILNFHFLASVSSLSVGIQVTGPQKRFPSSMLPK